jgi:hypothetical protein
MGLREATVPAAAAVPGGATVMVGVPIMEAGAAMAEVMATEVEAVMVGGIRVDMATGQVPDMGIDLAMDTGIGPGLTIEGARGLVLDGVPGGGAILSTGAFPTLITLRPWLSNSRLLLFMWIQHLSPTRDTTGITAKTPRATIPTSESAPRGGQGLSLRQPQPTIRTGWLNIQFGGGQLCFL